MIISENYVVYLYKLKNISDYSLCLESQEIISINEFNRLLPFYEFFSYDERIEAFKFIARNTKYPYKFIVIRLCKKLH